MLNSTLTLKQGHFLLENSLCPCTLDPGYNVSSLPTSVRRAARCCGVRVSAGVCPSVSRPPA